MKYKLILKSLFFILLVGCNSDDTETVKLFSTRIQKIEILSASENINEYILTNLEDSIKMIQIDLNQLDISENNKKLLKNNLDSLGEKIHISRLKFCLIGSSFTKNHLKPGGHNGDAIHDAVSDSFFGGIFTTVKITDYEKCFIISNFNGNFDESFKNALRSAFFGNNSSTKKKATIEYIGNGKFRVSNGWIIEVTDIKSCKTKLVSTN